MNMGSPIVVGPGEGHSIQGPVGGLLTFKARSEQSGGTLTAFENTIAPGEGPPLHTHDVENESWYVLEGRLRFKLGEDLRDAPAGSFVFVPHGVPHCFQNVGDTPAKILVLFTPGGMEAFFDRFATLTKDEINPEAFAEIGSSVGMTVCGPPLAVSDPL